jgi:hypothetical protein
VSIEILVAVVAAFPPTLASLLAFLSSRSVRRSVATQGDAPIGPLVERLQQQVDQLAGKVGDVADRLASLEGRQILPVHLGRRVERLDEELREVRERLARMESRGA